MNVLLVGDMTPGWTSEQRCRALSSLGFRLTTLATKAFAPPPRVMLSVQARLYRAGFPIRMPEPAGITAALIATARRTKPDIIWIDKGLYVRRGTLEAIRTLLPACKIIGFSPDDMNARHNRSHDFDRHLDLY